MTDSFNNLAANSVSGVSARKDPLVGTLFADRYRILELLGRGGMGVVYKAQHEMMERLVAVKMLLPQFASDENSIKRFQREAKAASKISHPNIIALHDFGLSPDHIPYLVMDYLDGETLADAISKGGQIGSTRAANIFVSVCDALAHAHRLGIIHRDLKPSNIMLVRQGDQKDVPKVVDFGVAKLCEHSEDQKLTSTGEVFGSPVYMSPEQCEGADLDPRSDVYSLGCVLYEALTGKLPLVGKTVIETIARHLNATPPSFAAARGDLYIPEYLEKIVFKAMEKKPEKRFQSMDEMREALLNGLANSSSQASLRAISPTRTITGAHSLSSAQQPPAPAAERRWIPIAIGGAALLIIGGSALAFTMLTGGSHKAGPKEQQGATDSKSAAPGAARFTRNAPTSSRNTPADARNAPTSSRNTPADVRNAPTEVRNGPAEVRTSPAAVTKSVEKAKPKHHHETAVAKTQPEHATTRSASVDYTDAPLPTKHHHKIDGNQEFYNFRLNKESYGNPVALPTGGQ